MKHHLTGVLVCAALLVGCATTEDLDGVENRMERRMARLDAESRDTREQLQSFQLSRKSEDQKLREQSARLYATLEQIREENRVLNGRLDEISHSLQLGGEGQQMTQKGVTDPDQLIALEERILRNSERIQRMEQYLNLEAPKAGTMPPPAKQPPADASADTPSEKAIYSAAKEAFSQEDYEGARRGYQAFLDAYPKSKNADNAQFWIGETYYKEKWYEKAILEYQKVIETYPKGNKVRASLLKQGFSFYNIGDKANARLILKELISKYPKSNEAKLAEKKLKGF